MFSLSLGEAEGYDLVALTIALLVFNQKDG